jgi:hypothetical protein
LGALDLLSGFNLPAFEQSHQLNCHLIHFYIFLLDFARAKWAFFVFFPVLKYFADAVRTNGFRMAATKYHGLELLVESDPTLEAILFEEYCLFRGLALKLHTIFGGIEMNNVDLCICELYTSEI